MVTRTTTNKLVLAKRDFFTSQVTHHPALISRFHGKKATGHGRIATPSWIDEILVHR